MFSAGEQKSYLSAFQTAFFWYLGVDLLSNALGAAFSLPLCYCGRSRNVQMTPANPHVCLCLFDTVTVIYRSLKG